MEASVRIGMQVLVSADARGMASHRSIMIGCANQSQIQIRTTRSSRSHPNFLRDPRTIGLLNHRQFISGLKIEPKSWAIAHKAP